MTTDPDRAPRCVLLVEDEADARDALARALLAEGYDCVTAGTAAQALEAARGAPFVDIAVLDVVLGDGLPDGIDLIWMLRGQGVRAPVVLMTAFADSPRLKRALNAGVSYLIEKPFRARAIVAVVQRLLQEPVDLGHLVDRALVRAGLTDKEHEVARLLLKGLSNEEIATATSNSDKTIRQHVTALYRKVGVSSRAEFFHFVFPT
ncbi:MAG TPA: response regulator transcription factor [Polyangiaceae bacterium]|nr:response regulator transcription factor [Polyangiaceae bacterium]